MTNKFLNNVNTGKNSFWRYAVTSLMSFGVSEFVVIFYFVIFTIIYQLLMGNYGSDMVIYFIIIFFSFAASTIFLLVFLEFLHKRSVMSLVNTEDKYDVFGRSKRWIERIRWKRFFKGFLIWAIFLIIIQTVTFIIYPEDFTFNWDLVNFIYLFILFLIAIPIQVTLEELFFRGYLNQGLSLKIKNPITIITISSIIFGLGHLYQGSEIISITYAFYSAFIVGLIWSIITLLDNGIEWATGAHLANNFFAFVIIGGEESMNNFGTLFSVKGSDPVFDIIFSTVTIVAFLIILIIIKKNQILKL